MRRKRTLQSVPNGPLPTFEQNAASGRFETLVAIIEPSRVTRNQSLRRTYSRELLGRAAQIIQVATKPVRQERHVPLRRTSYPKNHPLLHRLDNRH